MSVGHLNLAKPNSETEASGYCCSVPRLTCEVEPRNESGLDAGRSLQATHPTHLCLARLRGSNVKVVGLRLGSRLELRGVKLIVNPHILNRSLAALFRGRLCLPPGWCNARKSETCLAGNSPAIGSCRQNVSSDPNPTPCGLCSDSSASSSWL